MGGLTVGSVGKTSDTVRYSYHNKIIAIIRYAVQVPVLIVRVLYEYSVLSKIPVQYNVV